MVFTVIHQVYALVRHLRLNFLRTGAVKRLNYLVSTTGNMRLFFFSHCMKDWTLQFTRKSFTTSSTY